jgi:hypothetical protein
MRNRHNGEEDPGTIQNHRDISMRGNE